jgi:chromate transporter
MSASSAQLQAPDAATLSRRPSVGSIAWVFARLGSTVFGGGTATIAILEEEIVERQHWLDRRETHLAFAVSRLTPGTNMLAFCTGVGWLMRRSVGAVVALVSVSVPCSVLAAALTAFYASWTQHALAQLALRGAMASAVAIMVSSCWTLVRPLLRSPYRGRVVLLFIGAFTLAIRGVAPLRVLALSAVLGALWTEPEDA